METDGYRWRPTNGEAMEVDGPTEERVEIKEEPPTSEDTPPKTVVCHLGPMGLHALANSSYSAAINLGLDAELKSEGRHPEFDFVDVARATDEPSERIKSEQEEDVVRIPQVPPAVTLKPWSCDLCRARFVSCSLLFAHERKHADDRPTRIVGCEVARPEPTHTGETPYACEASSAFRPTETGETPYPCEASSASRLPKTRPRQYACDTCDATFAYKPALRRHMDKHPAVVT